MDTRQNDYANQECWTMDEVMALLHVKSRKAILTAIRTQGLPAIKVGKLWRIPKRRFQGWQAERIGQV